MSRQLDTLNVSLPGRHLIEANAGTGKTYTIATLYLRLLVETPLTVDQILVMTYTRAATAELRERIGRWLRDARQLLDERSNTVQSIAVEPVVKAIIATVHDHQREPLLIKLSESLRDLDVAAIHTIHGFCNHLLETHGFSLGSENDIELIGDEAQLINTVTRQSWRRRAADLSPALARHVVGKKSYLSNLQALMREIAVHSEVSVLANSEPIEAGDTDWLDSLDSNVLALAEQIPLLWEVERDEILTTISRPERLRSNSKWRHSPPIVKRLAEFADLSIGQLLEEPLLQSFRRSAADYHIKQPKLRCRLFDVITEISERLQAREALLDQRLRELQLEIVDEIRAELPKYKRRQRVRSYNDLVAQVHAAVHRPNSAQLIESLRSSYRAGLIDEFQDTDPQQFAIVEKLFPADSDQPLFFVGDPKQAMYNFRGADVFAYLKAARSVSHRHTLERNWRSNEQLTAAINRVFAGRDAPFLIPEIDYQTSSVGQPQSACVDADGNSAPLRAWLLPVDNSTSRPKMFSKSRLSAMVAEATAQEIERLMNAGASIGDQAVNASDIAVLVRTHRQGKLVSDALKARGLRSVQVGRTRIFSLPEAGELESVLRAIAQPDDATLIRTALTTRLLGWSLAAVARLAEDDHQMEQQFAQFGQLNRLWQERGLASAILGLLQDFAAPQQLLRQEGGQRLLATTFQLLDLLYEQLGLVDDPARLLRWFRARRGDDQFEENEILQLETDTALVRVVTIHAAKGLEYPIVFCPFLWEAAERASGKQPVLFHDAQNDNALTMVLAANEVHQTRATYEMLAEDLRIAYVALTRAKQRAYFVWGSWKDAPHSALAYLLHQQSEPAAERDQRLFPGLDPNQQTEAIQARLEALEIDVRPLPGQADQCNAATAPANDQPRLLRVTRLPRSRQRVTSFSSLGMPHHDQVAMKPIAEGVLPSNRTIGTMLHEVLENLPSFDPSPSTLIPIVTSAMEKYAIDERWQAQIVDRIEHCLRTDLDDGGFHLAALDPADVLPEMAFDLKIDAKSLERLSPLLGEPNGVAPISADFLTGAIDLVVRWRSRYYVLDYKSNYLGPSLTDYQPEQLRQSIVQSRYDLQYLLYSVALHRYLLTRLPGYDPDQHFGGAYYLYLRGMDSQRGPASGVHRWQPQPGQLQQIDHLLGT